MSPYVVPPALVRLGARLVSSRVHNPRLPWEVQRRRLDKLMEPWPLPRGTSVTKTTWNGVPVEIVTAGRARPRARSGRSGQDTRPASGTAAVTVVHFHGGGYCVGSPAEARDWAAHLSARAGCRVVLPEYRLAPEHPFPAAVDDARAVVRAVLGEAASGEAASGAVVVSGDSAGGGLALGGLPALLIQCGTDDLLAPDSENLAVRAAAAGVDVTYSRWPGLWHDFALQPGITAAAGSALAQAAWFVARVSAPDGPEQRADTGAGPGADGG